MKERIIRKVEEIKRSHRIAIFVISCLIVFIFFYFFSFSPKRKKIKQLKSEIADLDRRIKIARRLAKRIKEFEEKERKVDEKFKIALKLLPDKREIPSLLTQINHLGKEIGLVFKLFKPGQEKKKGFYCEIPIQIEVEGRFHDIMKFIYKITTMERIVNVFDISMQPKEMLSTELKTNFKAVTYRFIRHEKK